MENSFYCSPLSSACEFPEWNETDKFAYSATDVLSWVQFEEISLYPGAYSRRAMATSPSGREDLRLDDRDGLSEYHPSRIRSLFHHTKRLAIQFRLSDTFPSYPKSPLMIGDAIDILNKLGIILIAFVSTDGYKRRNHEFYELACSLRRYKSTLHGIICVAAGLGMPDDQVKDWAGEKSQDLARCRDEIARISLVAWPESVRSDWREVVATSGTEASKLVRTLLDVRGESITSNWVPDQNSVKCIREAMSQIGDWSETFSVQADEPPVNPLPPSPNNTLIADAAKDLTRYPQWFVDLESNIGQIVTTPPVGLDSPLREVCETLSVAFVDCMLAVASLPLVHYQVPDFLLQRVSLSVTDARKAYFDAELCLLNSTLPNMALVILNTVLNQLASLRKNPMTHYMYRGDFAIHNPIGRLREYCVRVMLAASTTGLGPRQTPNEEAVANIATPLAVTTETLTTKLDVLAVEYEQVPETNLKTSTLFTPLKKPDGPFDADGFRFDGVEVRFGRAILRYRLILALWNQACSTPASPRPIEEVLIEVYGENNEIEDAAFRQLCSDTRGKLEANHFPLTILTVQGKVQFSSIS